MGGNKTLFLVLGFGGYKEEKKHTHTMILYSD